MPVQSVDAASVPVEGEYLHRLAFALWPICRSITGEGVRQSLRILQRELPDLDIIEVPSGTPVLDWTVPDEWNLSGAYLEGPDGLRVLDFEDSNVHVMSYSTPIDIRLPLADLQEHLHSEPSLPDAIPYVTSYYTRNWGLCLTQRQRDSLPDGEYHAVITSTLQPGSLTYGELVIPGDTSDEVLVTTCGGGIHPALYRR